MLLGEDRRDAVLFFVGAGEEFFAGFVDLRFH
jgi:hypothetical protein